MSAVAIIANAARASQAIPTNALSPNTSPFKPTSCSVEIFVSNRDPPIIGQLRDLPAVKYSSTGLFDFFILDTIT